MLNACSLARPSYAQHIDTYATRTESVVCEEAEVLITQGPLAISATSLYPTRDLQIIRPE